MLRCRSVSLDEWQDKHVKAMVRWGNKAANEYWEAGVPEDFYIPDENDNVTVMERWIREKYEKRRFVAKALPACANADVDLALPLAVLCGTGGGGMAKQAAAAAPKKLGAPPGSGAGAVPAAKPAAAAKAAAPAPKAAAPVASDDPFDMLGFDSVPTKASAAVAALPAASGLEAAFASSAFAVSAAAPAPAPAPASASAALMGLYGPQGGSAPAQHGGFAQQPQHGAFAGGFASGAAASPFGAFPQAAPHAAPAPAPAPKPASGGDVFGDLLG